MTEKIQAIVIKSIDRKEKDKSILLFSIENGKCWATLRGVKGSNAKMKAAQNPFCYGEFVLEDGKAGKVVTGFSSIETFYEISEDVDKFFEAMALLEVVAGIEFSSQLEQKEAFVLLLRSLKNLCFQKTGACVVLDKFMLEIFKIYGFPIVTEKCSCCGAKTFVKLYFDYQSGGLVCAKCKGYSSEELSSSVYSALKILSSADYEKLSTIKLAQGSELGLLRVLVRNFEAQFSKQLKFVGILS
jgi:DNA repair protein RecO (recombination protein O)